jgi:hypothetical protein
MILNRTTSQAFHQTLGSMLKGNERAVKSPGGMAPMSERPLSWTAQRKFLDYFDAKQGTTA